MAYYHASVDVVSRGKGKSLAAKASYLYGASIFDAYCGLTYHTYRSDVVHSEIILPMDAPRKYGDIQTLVTAIDQSENRCDSQTAREIIFALPKELSSVTQIDLARKCIKTFWVDRGMCAILAIHDKGENKYHAHVLLTTRTISGNGFGLKNREWNCKKLYREWRSFLADTINARFRQQGLDFTVSADSYFVQGVDLTPTHYLGPTASALTKRDIFTERAEKNMAIMEARKKTELEEEKRREKHYCRGRSV